MASILGIDIGGSGIKGAIINTETGEFIEERMRVPTPDEARPEGVAEKFKEVVENFNYTGIVGAGFPAVVRNGVTYTAANIDESWIGFDAAHLFSEVTGCRVYVANDADVAGMAEMKFGAGKGEMGTVLVLTLGTGIGTAVFTNGVLVPNLEMGHLIIRGKDAEKRASDAARQKKDYSWQKWGDKLQEYLSYIKSLINPDLIIIGGGVSKNHQEFFPYLKVRARLVPAQLLNQAGIVGAALYAEYAQGLEEHGRAQEITNPSKG